MKFKTKTDVLKRETEDQTTSRKKFLIQMKVGRCSHLLPILKKNFYYLEHPHLEKGEN